MKLIQDEMFVKECVHMVNTTCTAEWFIKKDAERRRLAAERKDAWRKRVRASARQLARQDDMFMKRDSIGFMVMGNKLPKDAKAAFFSERKRLLSVVA